MASPPTLEIFSIPFLSMSWPTGLFLNSFGGINILLLCSYYVLRVNVKDFGSVPVEMRKFFLISAGLAYVGNLIHITMMSTKINNPFLQFAALSYYVMQLLFIPFLRHGIETGNKLSTRILLFLACIPLAYIHNISENNLEWYITLFVLLHVFINDFLLFSFMF